MVVGSCGCLFLAVVFSFMRSRVQVILYLAGIFCLAVASYSCGQILWLSSISCGRFFDFFDLLRLSSISCGRGVLAVVGFLQSSGSCGCRVLAIVGLLHFSSCLRHCRFLSGLSWSLASVSTWLVVGFMFVVALAFLVAMFVTVAVVGLPMLAACYRLFFVPLFLPPPVLLLSWPVIVALKNVY